MEPNEQSAAPVENTEGQQTQQQTTEAPQAETPPTNNNQKPNQQKNTGVAILAYIIFFLPLLTEAKNDPFVKFHVKQGLVVFLLACVVQVIGFVIFFGGMLISVLYLGVLVLAIIGIMNAANGEQKELPIVGQFAKNFNF